MYDFVQFANQHDHVFRAPLKYLSEADARLIAAAPELYEALITCAAVFAGDTLYKGALVHALEKTKAALAKARGEQ
jgi:hypothetical protein